MLNAKEIENLMRALNDRLKKEGVKGEIGIVGGAAICLLFNQRAATKDVDAIFEPAALLRKMAEEISREKNLPTDWLNDAVKAFLSDKIEKKIFLELSHLVVWCPTPQYLLAMKCLSARWDSSDADDVKLLINHLKLKKTCEALEIIEDYYPKKQIPVKTQFFIEELFDK